MNKYELLIDLIKDRIISINTQERILISQISENQDAAKIIEKEINQLNQNNAEASSDETYTTLEVENFKSNFKFKLTIAIIELLLLFGQSINTGLSFSRGIGAPKFFSLTILGGIALINLFCILETIGSWRKYKNAKNSICDDQNQGDLSQNDELTKNNERKSQLTTESMNIQKGIISKKNRLNYLEQIRIRYQMRLHQLEEEVNEICGKVGLMEEDIKNLLNNYYTESELVKNILQSVHDEQGSFEVAMGHTCPTFDEAQWLAQIRDNHIQEEQDTTSFGEPGARKLEKHDAKKI